MDNNIKELKEDIKQLKSELEYLTSLSIQKIQQVEHLEDELNELDMRRDLIKRQLYDVENLLNDALYR